MKFAVHFNSSIITAICNSLHRENLVLHKAEDQAQGGARLTLLGAGLP